MGSRVLQSSLVPGPSVLRGKWGPGFCSLVTCPSVYERQMGPRVLQSSRVPGPSVHERCPSSLYGWECCYDDTIDGRGVLISQEQR